MCRFFGTGEDGRCLRQVSMQLFRVKTDDSLNVEGEVSPVRFKDWTVGGVSGREEHIEELLLRYPGLLNFDAFDLGISSNDEVLIVSQQPVSSNRKRADLLGVHRDGSLVVIEIKRDAEDARHRAESLEFQALRYAAASRRMTASDVISHFKDHLKKREGSQANDEVGDAYWRALAIQRLGTHLSEEDEEVTEDDLFSLINPRKQQKIYLVAAGYEGDATAACAWLREHGIDICAFRLRPYSIAGQPILERERLIPPPELDEFMSETFATSAVTSETQATTSKTRASTVKPKELTWSDRDDPVRVNAWKALLQHVVTRVLSEGMSPQALPIKSDPTDKSGMFAAAWIDVPAGLQNGSDDQEQGGMFVDLHGSAEQIRNSVDKILQDWDVDVTLQVETRDGETYEFPRST